MDLPKRFEWDENKNTSNERKHGINFASAIKVFSDPAITTIESRQPSGETRYLSVGRIDGVFVTVVFTLRGDRVRIISARRSRPEERKRYER
jgi:uncharacterized protein